MMNKILEELTIQHGSPCVSIILSTDLKSFEDKDKIWEKFRITLNRLATRLEVSYDKDIAKKLTRLTKSLMEEVDLDNLEKGIGIYVSETYSKLLSFPFDVKDDVFVSYKFKTSEIEEKNGETFRYLALALSKNKTRLFEGRMNLLNYMAIALSKNKTRLFEGKMGVLEEINDENFPMHFENEFQLKRASQHSLYNGEESKINQARLENYYREIDKTLGNYIGNKPLVILGVTRHLTDFKSITKYKNHIIAEIEGNYDRHSIYNLSELVIPEIESELHLK